MTRMRHRIFVPLLSDSAELRELDAVPAGEGTFRIVGSPPRGERLQFKRGEIVECDIRTLPAGMKGLVAIRSVSADPEFRKRRNVYAVCGAMVGAIVGTAAAFQFDVSARSAIVGAVSGAVIFAYCSVRWGDSAWDALRRILG